MSALKSPVLAVDGIFLRAGKFLMAKRAIEPFKDYWVFPAGKVKYGETVEKALKREMKEELGINIRIKKLVGIYSDPKRDPRYHAISLSFLCEPVRGKIKLNNEASLFRYFSFDRLPQKIGFDHRKIIQDLEKLLKSLK